MTLLNLKEVCYEADNTKILDHVSLEIEQGDCVSLVGASGSGKSTLLKLCADLLTATEGELYYKDKPYKDYNPLNLRKKISYCVQLPYLFGDTVYENVAFPFEVRREKVDTDRINQLMGTFGMDESFLHKNIHSLSGGEKQRIALARNLMYTPEVLLLDEATSALDPETAEKVEKYIQSLNTQGTTVVWITHNIEQSQGIFHKRIKMANGRIVEQEVFGR